MTETNTTSSVLSSATANSSPAEARKLLTRDDCQAFSAVVAAFVLFGDEILDEDGQPLTEAELREFAEGINLRIPEETMVRVCGCLHALCGDQFMNHPVHFERLTGAIIKGDPFVYEDDDDTPTLPDALWAIYQVGLMLEDEVLLADLSPSVRKFLDRIGDDEAEDPEELALAFGDAVDQDTPQSYAHSQLRLYMHILAQELVGLGFEEQDMRETSSEMADLMAKVKAG